MFSQPCTPVKLLYNSNNTARTPDHKQQLVADVGSFYLASLRQQQQQTTASACKPDAPTPTKHSDSPASKHRLQPDAYVSQRDCSAAKLLRSPAAFKHTLHAPSVAIKSFSARFEAFHTAPPTPPPVSLLHVTPTEEEFMALLFKNHHLPADPECLIGRHMGLEHLDVVHELRKRSMHNLLDKIFGYVGAESPRDLVRAASVNREWRRAVKSVSEHNKARDEFLRERKAVTEFQKENRVLAKSTQDKAVWHQNQQRRSELEAAVDMEAAASTSCILSCIDPNLLAACSGGGAQSSNFKTSRLESVVKMEVDNESGEGWPLTSGGGSILRGIDNSSRLNLDMSFKVGPDEKYKKISRNKAHSPF